MTLDPYGNATYAGEGGGGEKETGDKVPQPLSLQNKIHHFLM